MFDVAGLRRWRWVPACGFILAALGLGLFALRAYRWQSSLHQDRVRLSRQDVAAAHAALGAFADVSFQTSDHITLRGWYVAPHGRGIVVFVHGGYNHRAPFLPVAAALVRAGHGVLLYDSRGAGESGEALTTWGDHEQRDLAAALDFLTARGAAKPGCVGVQGFSIGASTAAMLASYDARVSALVLNGVWSSLSGEIAYKSGLAGSITAAFVRLGFLLRGVDTAHVVPQQAIQAFSPRPLLVIGGAADEDTPPAASQAVFAAAGEPKTLWIIPGAHHGDYLQVAGQSYLQRVLEFFDQHLCSDKGP